MFITAQKLFALSLIISQRQTNHDLLVSQPLLFQTYDYIVVGAGTAGCVVAARLAEDESSTVLLLEAGGPQTTDSDIPAKQKYLIGTKLDWSYPMVPQQNAYLARNDHQINLPRGRVFGGSSVLNSMNYYRESPEYFQLWQDLYGIKNWTFNDVLPFFLRLENNMNPDIVRESNGLHRTGGPLSVTTATTDIMLERYLNAAQMMGYHKTYTDGLSPFGVSIMQRTIKDGLRQSSSVAFLFNLNNIGNSHVTKILFDGHKRAIGVTFRRFNADYVVYARKEVIISAGVIGSPQLLMLSGIGPEVHLRDLNIPVVSNLRVGDNLLRSIFFELNFDVKDQSHIQKPFAKTDNHYDYYVEKTGPLAYKASGVHCFREIPYGYHSEVSNGCVLSRLDFLDYDLDKLEINLKFKNQWEDYYRSYLGRAFFGLLSIIRRPKSKGTIRLKSDNPFDYPLIDPCIFCEQSDIDDLIKTTKLSLAIYRSPYFQQFAEVYKDPIPGCNPCLDDYFCDLYAECVAKTITEYISPVGTCKMGSISDTEAVVDNRLRVRGVSGLRVIDSSVLPVVSEQTYAIAIMIGERGAQFVREDSI